MPQKSKRKCTNEGYIPEVEAGSSTIVSGRWNRDKMNNAQFKLYNALATVTIDYSRNNNIPTLEPDQAIIFGMRLMTEKHSANGLHGILGEEISNMSQANLEYHENVYDILNLSLTYCKVRLIDIGVYNEFLRCAREKCAKLDQEKSLQRKDLKGFANTLVVNKL